MRLPRDKDVLENARALRKSMTREERHLWYDFLRGYSPRFVRQKVVGRYILDFYCDAAGLAIELDGSRHYEAAGISGGLRNQGAAVFQSGCDAAF